MTPISASLHAEIAREKPPWYPVFMTCQSSTVPEARVPPMRLAGLLGRSARAPRAVDVEDET